MPTPMSCGPFVDHSSLEPNGACHKRNRFCPNFDISEQHHRVAWTSPASSHHVSHQGHGGQRRRRPFDVIAHRGGPKSRYTPTAANCFLRESKRCGGRKPPRPTVPTPVLPVASSPRNAAPQSNSEAQLMKLHLDARQLSGCP